MVRSAPPAHAAAAQRRRPLLYTSAAVALLVAGWAVTDSADAAGGSGPTRAAARTAPAPKIPRQSGAPRPVASAESGGGTRLLPSPVVSADALGPTAAPWPSSGAALRASLSTATATAGDGAAEKAGAAVHELPITLDKGSRAALSIAALDLTDGRRAGYGTSGEAAFDTASIVKVDVLAALLLQAQDAGHGLTDSQRSLASDMIRASDNKATDHLWNTIGGTAGLTRANHRLGLTHTTAGAGGLWGLTQTTAHDQLTLLSAIYGTGHSVLSAASRSYASSLMARVEKDQRWGVSAGGTPTGLKNGWLPRSATGKWDINSIGLVTAGGHRVLLATLSSGNTGMDAGISLVEKGARAAVATLGLRDTA
ncbi:serine hydrolase [Streptomyces sp. 8L]|uniref:serine hydrolase n=1 Tax=Streptomyces sp. 8L TaxID=2877242 RepID=UPI001CD69482|nr:serine hydrolase [Streptomyces sp. 8L]MCA1218964.1 class A beta-lactamase-related serine hydrolase [Streptomyces sp. 8L]